MNISNKIYHLRKTRGYSQEELANAVGVSRQAVSKWESGQSVPDSDRLILLSNFFNISIDELLKGSPSAEVSQTSFRKKHRYILAIILCVIGFVGSCCLTLWTLLNSEKSSQSMESITINLNGYTLLCALFAAIFITGSIAFCVLHFLNRR